MGISEGQRAHCRDLADQQGRVRSVRTIIGSAYSGEELDGMADALISLGVKPSEIASAMTHSGCGHQEDG